MGIKSYLRKKAAIVLLKNPSNRREFRKACHESVDVLVDHVLNNAFATIDGMKQEDIETLVDASCDLVIAGSQIGGVIRSHTVLRKENWEKTKLKLSSIKGDFMKRVSIL